MFYQRLLASQDQAPVSAEIQTTESALFAICSCRSISSSIELPPEEWLNDFLKGIISRSQSFHNRLLMRVQDTKARQFYLEECAKSGWSSRQLERQIHTMFYQRLLKHQVNKKVLAIQGEPFLPGYKREAASQFQ